ncbi:hypothetical protein C8F01DRAFT_1267067 [Mycena amicta]|nr:hypothetical protein C8F01DRAFT_1267067 [Mycena amicta]
MDSLSLDVMNEILEYLPLFDLHSFADTFRAGLGPVTTVLNGRRNRLFAPFIPLQARDRFDDIVDSAGGGLVGSGVAWISQPDPDWHPYDLNFIVANDSGPQVAIHLQQMGYHGHSISSHVPVCNLVMQDGEMPVYGHPLTDRWMLTTTRFVDGRGRVITVTSTKDTNVLRTLLGADSTMGMAILARSALVVLYPSLWRFNQGVWREGSIAHANKDSARIATRHSWAARGFLLGPPSYANASMECFPRCCSEPRQFRGGRGVAVVRLDSRQLPSGFARDAANGLQGGEYGLSLVLGTCHNRRCSFFRYPSVSIRSTTLRPMQPISGNRKFDLIEARSWLVRHRDPPFIRLYKGLLLATSVHQAVWVPLALGDHALHANDYRTIDDLRTSTWVKCVPEGAEPSPLFAGAGTVVGAPVFSNALVQKYRLNGIARSYDMVLFHQTASAAGVVNRHFHPDGCNCTPAICGDVLAVFFRDDVLGPIQPDAADLPLATCATHPAYTACTLSPVLRASHALARSTPASLF